jgi:hypothetical protein
MGATNEKQETPNAKITEKYEEKSKLENDPSSVCST